MSEPKRDVQPPGRDGQAVCQCPRITRADVLALLVLTTLFLGWVGAVVLRQRSTGAGVSLIRADENAPVYRVDVNRAPRGELMLLPGIGEKRSERIIAWREARGRIADLDQLRQATGLGEAQIERLSDLVTFGGD